MYPVYISGNISFIWMVAKGKQLGPSGFKKNNIKKRAFWVDMRLSDWANILNLDMFLMSLFHSLEKADLIY